MIEIKLYEGIKPKDDLTAWSIKNISKKLEYNTVFDFLNGLPLFVGIENDWENGLHLIKAYGDAYPGMPRPVTIIGEFHYIPPKAPARG